MDKYVISTQYVNEFVKNLGYNPTGNIYFQNNEEQFNGKLVDIEILNSYNQTLYLQAEIKPEAFKIYHHNENNESLNFTDQSQKWIFFQIEKDKKAARHLKNWAKNELKNAETEEKGKIEIVKDQYKVRKNYFNYLISCIDKKHPDEFANAYGNNE